MNERPDGAWRLKWLQSKDGLEIEAWAVGEKGYKFGSIAKRITNRSSEIKEASMALMKQVGAEAMLDLLGENGVVTVVDLQ
ncbi:MAG TPA: hypothetical protein VFE60_08475 [Roseiarcus sp.]|jgi:hypothetical protein|nr:hypothetical protein [Roseiarcus sp.]